MCQNHKTMKQSLRNFKSTMLVNKLVKKHTSGTSQSLEKIDENAGSIILKQSFKQRKKIWQLEHNYHCAVIGTCLTLAETRKLVSHFVQNTHAMSDYDFHTHAVHMISNNDKLGKKIHNFLDRKFNSTIKQIKKLDNIQLRQYWQSSLKSGDVIATFWALITHPNICVTLSRDIYGDIHMMSHLSGASQRADLHQLAQLQQQQNKVKQESENWKHRFEQSLMDNEKLRNKLEQLRENNTQVSLQLNYSQQSLTALVEDSSEKQRQCLQQKLEKLQQQVDHLDAVNDKLEQQVLQSNTPSDHDSVLTSSTEYYCSVEETCNDCPVAEMKSKEANDLCGRCILYVGGRSRLTPHFKKLVEKKEATFLYHDGGIEQSSQELSSLLNKADLVVFPMDCVSHKAYFQLKKACKKQQKPYKTLNSSGVSSFSSLLNGLTYV